MPITQKSVAEDDKGKICNFLYDGQTNRLLAATVHAISGEKAGDVFDPRHVSPPPRSNSVEARMNDDYEDEDNYIHRLMSEDRETRQ